MSQRIVRVRFFEFDTTSEISRGDGSTYLVVTVSLALEEGGVSRRVIARVGIATSQGRRHYELLEEAGTGAIHAPPVARAIVEYVKEVAPRFHFPGAHHEQGAMEKTIELMI